MINKKISIIYLAHGPKHLHRQSIFSIITLAYHLNFDFANINLVVYTDDPHVFKLHLKDIPIQFEIITKEQVKGYIKNEYVHRVKICVIRECMRNYNTDILFVDGDTYFVKSPAELINKISKECTVFYSLESTIADGGHIHEVPIWLTLRKLARNYEYEIRGEKFKLGFDSEVWNSGILGLSKEHYHLVEDVLALNDQMTANAKFKTAEQFAFAFILKKVSTLISGEEYIFHYYLNNFKNIYNYHIERFLKRNCNDNITVKAQKAIQLYQSQDNLSLPEKNLIQKLQLRLALIWKVAKYGHL